MSKSKYPESIDTSIELPIVRDNIIQIGSEAINSLRSAILQVEKTLGTMPNGIPSITVADRLNKSLDDLGNIKKEAIAALNLISGPITNAEVSDNANIEESKLDLDYKTSTLYAQSLNLQSQISSFIQTINDLSLKISIHLNPDAIKAHMGKNIGVEDITISASDITKLELASKNVQEVLEQIINNHISYTGENITSLNNSHSANQIFYNSLESGLAASSVQEAIDNLSGQGSDVGQNIRDLYFNNGYQKTSVLGIQQNRGRIIAENISATFSKYNENSDDNFSIINYTATLSEVPEKYDLVLISENLYQIHSINTATKSIKIYGNLLFASITGQTITLLKNNHQQSSFAGLKLIPVHDTNLSFSKVLKLLNPSTTYVISEDVFPDKINSSNQTFSIEIDSITTHSFSVNTATGNSIDSIISNINKECSKENLPLSAFRVDTKNGSKIGLAIDFVNNDEKIYYIKLTSSNNSLDYLGFSNSKDLKIYGNFGSVFHINGKEFEDFKTKVISSDFIINSGNNTIDLSESDVTILDLGVKKNDLLQIQGSSANDGIYRITSLSNTSIEVDIKSGSSFNVDTSTSTVFKIQENSVGLDDISYENISTGGFETSIVEVFIDEDQEVSYKQVLEYESVISGTTPLFSIIELSKDLEDKNYSFDLALINSSNKDDGFSVTLDGIETLVEVPSGEITLNLRTSDNKYIKIIFSVAALLTKLDTGGSISSTLYIKKSINNKHNLFLGRIKFDDFRNLITGLDINYRQINYVDQGFISEDEISSEFLNKVIYRRFSETRSSGVIVGLDILNATLSSSTTYQFNISSGICYIDGRRFEINEKTIITNINPTSSDKIFIGIDTKGNVIVKEPIKIGSPPVCVSPFDGKNNLTLGTIEYNSSSATFFIFDLKLNISDIDLKLFNDIIVSPVEGLGHFTTLSKALRVAKRFGEIFSDAGIPKIKLKAGTYKENLTINDTSGSEFGTNETLEYATNGIYIDFPVIIEGEGEDTVLDLSHTYTDTVGNSKETDILNRGSLRIMGNSGASYSSLPSVPNATELKGNVTIKNLKLYNSKIVISDQLYKDSSNYLSQVITLENIYFKADTTWGFGLVSQHKTNIPSNDKSGNIRVINCKFEDCGIKIANVTYASRIQNYEISECIFSRPNVSASSNDTAVYLSDESATNTVDNLPTSQYFLSMEGNCVHDLAAMVKTTSGSLTGQPNFPKKGSMPGEYYFYKIDADFINVGGSPLTGNTSDVAFLGNNQAFTGINTFSGPSSFYGNTTFSNIATYGSNTFGGVATFNSTSDFNGTSTFNDTTIFEGNTDFNGAINAISGLSLFSSESTTQFYGEVDFYATVDLNANLNVNGTIDLTGDLDVSGALTVGGDLTVSGDLSAEIIRSKTFTFMGADTRVAHMGYISSVNVTYPEADLYSVLFSSYASSEYITTAFVAPNDLDILGVTIRNFNTSSLRGRLNVLTIPSGSTTQYSNTDFAGDFSFEPPLTSPFNSIGGSESASRVVDTSFSPSVTKGTLVYLVFEKYSTTDSVSVNLVCELMYNYT